MRTERKETETIGRRVARKGLGLLNPSYYSSERRFGTHSEAARYERVCREIDALKQSLAVDPGQAETAARKVLRDDVKLRLVSGEALRVQPSHRSVLYRAAETGYRIRLLWTNAECNHVRYQVAIRSTVRTGKNRLGRSPPAKPASSSAGARRENSAGPGHPVRADREAR